MASRRAIDVARSYWAAARVLLEQAGRVPHELDFPALFVVRHVIELYLKALLPTPPEHHDLERLIELVEKEYGGKLAPWIGARLRDFHLFDRRSDYFRYGQNLAAGEYWVDFGHLRSVLEELVGAFEHARGQSRT